MLASVCEGLAIQRAGVWFFDQAHEAIRCRLLIDLAHGTETEDLALTQRDYPAYFRTISSQRSLTADYAAALP